MFESINRKGRPNHRLSPEDQCNNCKHFNNGCALIEALANGMVVMAQEFNVVNCLMHNPIRSESEEASASKAAVLRLVPPIK